MNNVILLNSGKTEGSDSNFFTSMNKGVSLSLLKEFIPNNTLQTLKSIYPDNKAYIWGLKDLNLFEKISKNDLFWFCSENIYHSLSKVIVCLKGDYALLSNEIWKTDQYPYIVFVDKPIQTKFTRSEVQTTARLSENYTFFGAHYLNDNTSKRIISKFRLDEVLPESLSDESIGEGSGKDAKSDSIASKDELGRDILIKNLSKFYTEFTVENKKPFFMGVFAGWGRGKSSFIEMLTKKINSHQDENITHIISKIDTSLMDKKDTVWLSILAKLIIDVEKENKENTIFKNILSKINFFAFNATKTQFNLLNILKVLKLKKGIILFMFSLAVGAVWLLEPTKGLNVSSGKDIAGWVALTTLLITFMKSIQFKVNDILLPSDDSKIKNSYFKSKYEFKQLLKMLDANLKENHMLRILIVLDEVDRMNKNLISELVEVIQQLKGLQDTQDEHLNVTIDFLFSFNHEIVFPSIGKEVSLGDKELLIDSYGENMMSSHNEKSINTFKLGKEYMDKYLDLTIYLDEEMNTNQLIDSLYSSNTSSTQSEIGTLNNVLEEIKNSSEKETETLIDNENLNAKESVLKQSFVFTEKEIEIIKFECSNLNDPRKILRLKNALLLLRMINIENPPKKSDLDIYHQELKIFISSYISDLKSEDEAKTNRYLKYTNYFLPKINTNIKNKENNDKKNNKVANFIIGKNTKIKKNNEENDQTI